MKKYEWTRRLASVDADVVGTELERIINRDGRVTPAAVVDEARPEESPIHPVFEWDDSVAGEKYRIFQARNVIRAVVRVGESESGEKVIEPVLVHVPQPGDPHYQDPRALQRDEFVLAIEELAKKVAGAQHALDRLRQIAEGRGDDTLALLACAASALATARESISRVN